MNSTVRSRRFVRIGVIVAFVAALAGAGSVDELGNSQSALAAGRVVHHVSAGGPDQIWWWCPGKDAEPGMPGDHPGCDGSFALEVNQYADGTASGQFTDQYAQGDGGVHAAIDCLSIDGNTAWVSGTFTHGGAWWGGTFYDFTGLPFQATVRDNGQSANDPPDQITNAAYGEGWAANCSLHYVRPGAEWNYVLNDMPKGQVRVR